MEALRQEVFTYRSKDSRMEIGICLVHFSLTVWLLTPVIMSDLPDHRKHSRVAALDMCFIWIIDLVSDLDCPGYLGISLGMTVALGLCTAFW